MLELNCAKRLMTRPTPVAELVPWAPTVSLLDAQVGKYTKKLLPVTLQRKHFYILLNWYIQPSHNWFSLRASNSKTHLDIRRRDFTSSQVWRKLNVDSDAFLTQARCQWSTPWVSKKLTRGGRRRKRILQIRWKKQTVLFFLSLNAETFYECDRNTFPLDEKIHFLNLIFCLFQYQKLLAGNFKKHSCCHLLVFTIFAKFFARFDTNWRRC